MWVKVRAVAEAIVDYLASWAALLICLFLLIFGRETRVCLLLDNNKKFVLMRIGE